MDGLRGAKRDTWEGGHRVPFLARWPGHIPPGATSSETLSTLDFLSTSPALTGTKLPPNGGEDSCNILPALLGQKLRHPIREATGLPGGNGNFAIRHGE